MDVASYIFINAFNIALLDIFILANCHIPAEPGTTENMEEVINVASPLMEKFPISAVLHKIFK